MLNKRVALLLGVCLMVAACGRMSSPEKPKDSVYPRTYVVTQNAE